MDLNELRRRAGLPPRPDVLESAEPTYPDYHGDGYLQWKLPPIQPDEDSITIQYDMAQQHWFGYTEYDQNVKRDLSPREVEQLRHQYNLQILPIDPPDDSSHRQPH